MMPFTVVTATGLEAGAARRELPRDVRVVQCGVALSRRSKFDDAAISCGLAGGTDRYLPSGTVLVPSEVGGPDGFRRVCDPELVGALTEGARRLGLEPVTAPLFTSPVLVRGAERARYCEMGFAGVDMETALIDAPKIAAVRVVLDTPTRELSEAWLSPLRVLVTPSAWSELPWLLREAPRLSRLAARVIASALPAK